jgi:hypothetical protein
MACCDSASVRRHLVIDDQGEVWEATTEEFALWARSLEPSSDKPINAAVALGFVHVWQLGQDVVVSLWPERMNPVTMAGAIDEIARLGQEWTIVCSLAPGGTGEVFCGYMPAVWRITDLMAEAGKIEPCANYDMLETAAAEFEGRAVFGGC